MFDEKAQRNLLELCISDKEIFTQVRTILQAKYFDSQFQKVVNYLLQFSAQYNSLPLFEQINNEARLPVPLKKIEGVEGNLNIRQSILDTAEAFCKQRALELAVIECSERIAKGQSTGIDSIIKDAQKVSLKKDFGINFWENPKSWLEEQESEAGVVSTGWKALDDMLNGGFGWGELEYFIGTANSGKSLTLNNVALNFSRLGHTVLFFTLEMDMKLVGKRLTAMATDMPYKGIRFNIDDYANRIVCERMRDKPGTLQIVNIPIGCTINDIEAYTQEFELQTNLTPDIFIVDYADIMSPADKRCDVNNLGLVDNKITLELRNFVRERTHHGKPSLCITASQITKDAMAEEEFNMSNVAGGKAKSTNADNMVVISTSDAMREKGEYRFSMMKTRNSAGKGKKFKIKFNVDSLRMTDIEDYEEKGATVAPNSVENATSTAALNGVEMLKQKLLQQANKN